MRQTCITLRHGFAVRRIGSRSVAAGDADLFAISARRDAELPMEGARHVTVIRETGLNGHRLHGQVGRSQQATGERQVSALDLFGDSPAETLAEPSLKCPASYGHAFQDIVHLQRLVSLLADKPHGRSHRLVLDRQHLGRPATANANWRKQDRVLRRRFAREQSL
jgi:hypothetical protein